MLLQSILLASAPLLVLARTDLSGCVATTNGPVVTWFVPGTGELCDFLDCGGGRAPPKTTVPGCAAYAGTASYSPSYLPGYGPNGQVPQSTTTSTAVQPTQSTTTSGTVVVVPSSSGSVSGAASASASGSARTTAIATLTSSRVGGILSNGTTSGSGIGILTQTANAGHAVGGTIAAVGGIVMGALAML